MIFAVDFDGTLSFGQWPEVGPANDGLIRLLKKRRLTGDKLILWTCREGAELDAVNDAIAEKKKISFIYNDYGTDFQLHPRREMPYIVILFMTGWDWLNGFTDLFQETAYFGRNCLRGKNTNSIYVEGTARIGNAKAVIMCRPEYRNKGKYVQDAVQAFRDQ